MTPCILQSFSYAEGPQKKAKMGEINFGGCSPITLFSHQASMSYENIRQAWTKRNVEEKKVRWAASSLAVARVDAVYV